MEFSLKKYVGDYEKYVELQSTSHIPYREEWYELTKKSIQNNIEGIEDFFGGVIFGFYHNDELVGACKLLNFYSDKSIIEVFDVVISPSHRGKDYGSKMIMSLIEEIKSKYPSRKKLFLSTGGACDFYAKLGLKTIGNIDNRVFMYIDL